VAQLANRSDRCIQAYPVVFHILGSSVETAQVMRGIFVHVSLMRENILSTPLVSILLSS
jgi:hypothetical protein